ncbi:MAG: vitamin B12-dependent ribonucleotide reductase [Candidatus Jorgensenbacteria bacterium]|nr:vitamin B12-dependent ribonucleotide reductase [Candidatus Jorgensenbacteria bacterium]
MQTIETRTPQTASEQKHGNGTRGLPFGRHFTKPGIHPFDEIEWEKRSAVITNEKGKEIFRQDDVEIPKSWSMTATNVVVSKYFHGQLGSPERETSVRQLIERVARAYFTWGRNGGYFTTEEDAEIFYHELCFLLVNQYMAFNSPVWFNVGAEECPQCSACFINSVKDDMGSILDLAKTEGMLFKHGSGTGSNLSTLRSAKEKMSHGGTPSGPVSFMKGFDAFAGVIKSGGKTRRAAKMVILNVDHPDIVEFVNCKAEEEKKAHVLIDHGYDGGFNVPGGAYDSVAFQNANHSVRVTDEFMQAVIEDKEWVTLAVTTGKPVEKLRARDIMRQIAEAAWVCGDPGLQFHTVINAWHTCSVTAPINGSNPCAEYMFLDDTACNLASLNLMKFRREDGSFDAESFRKAIAVTITAMEISVDNSSYPTPVITQNSYDYRPLGLGYANLGALLMAQGLPYDSDEGRALAAAITALMTGEAYAQSARIAAVVEPFRGFKINREPTLRVLEKHCDATRANYTEHSASSELAGIAISVWNEAVALAKAHGVRNAQATVLAPTGTIGFMMDCDTTGVEPDIALVKYKKLVGGGYMKIVNQTVPEALAKLGYDDEAVEAIVKYIDEHDTIEGAPHLKPEHLPVFDCAFKPANGERSIHYMGHIKMMSAVQPFLSGAISKTVNMPNAATTEEIQGAYMEAWKLGLKAIAVYRDGCKRTQPLSTSRDAGGKVIPKPARRHLPDLRQSVTQKFSVAGHEGYLTVGMFEDGSPGEVFITMSKEGSTISGLMDVLATAISIALQYGVPLRVFVDKFSHVRFEPAGHTNIPEIPMAKSVADLVFRWMGLKFLPPDEQPVQVPIPMNGNSGTQVPVMMENDRDKTIREVKERTTFKQQSDAPPCSECGQIMIRSGSCYKCLQCGSTSGCS